MHQPTTTIESLFESPIYLLYDEQHALNGQLNRWTEQTNKRSSHNITNIFERTMKHELPRELPHTTTLLRTPLCFAQTRLDQTFDLHPTFGMLACSPTVRWRDCMMSVAARGYEFEEENRFVNSYVTTGRWTHVTQPVVHGTGLARGHRELPTMQQQIQEEEIWKHQPKRKKKIKRQNNHKKKRMKRQ